MSDLALNRTAALTASVLHSMLHSQWLRRIMSSAGDTTISAGLLSAVTVLVALGGGVKWYFDMVPTVDFYTEDATEKPIVGLSITNHGPGQATIKSIVYYVDRKPMKDDDEVLAIAKISNEREDGVRLDPGDILGAGETVWLFARSTKGKSKKELNRYIELLDDRLGALVTYCSSFGQCWQRCSIPERC